MAIDGEQARRGGWRVAAWVGLIAVILLIPLVAMRFTDEVAWTPLDFAAAGAILAGAALAYELGASKSASVAYRAGVGVAVAAAFFMVWVSVAVGIIGSEQNDANLMFAGVLVIGLIGALVARFQAVGMARTLIAMAIAQVLAAGIALSAGWGAEGPNYPWDIVGLTGFFTAAWLVSAWLFRRAA